MQGNFKLKRKDFERSWISDNEEGVIILFETTPTFYSKDNPTPSVNTGLTSLFTYLNPYRGLIGQVIIAMLLLSLFQLILPFLTQSIVDVGIENQNLGFVRVILAAMAMLYFSQLAVTFVQNWILLHIGSRINVALISDFLIKLMRAVFEKAKGD